MGIQEQQSMRKVQQRFKMRGLTLTLDALKAVMTHIEELCVSIDEGLAGIFSQIDKSSLKSNFVKKDEIAEILSALQGREAQGDKRLCIVDVFSVPKLCYDYVRKSFYRYQDKLVTHGDAPAKAALYRDRFQLLQQRVLRDRHFSRPAFGKNSSASGSCELTTIQALAGYAGKAWVMGTIYQVEDGRFCLEDLTGSVRIEFAEAKITTGFFTENCIVIAEGVCHADGVLKTRLEQLEERANDMFVILAEMLLDLEETLEKLTQVFSGFEALDVVPSLFVFMGNFCSHPCNLAFDSFSELRSHFAKLGELINAYPRIKATSRFVFIPGPEDIGPSSVLPRPPLFKYFTSEVSKHVPNAVFGTNPCRIRFYSQEIVLFREELLYRMRRNCILPPSEDETQDNFQHLVTTILHQSHLCPLPLTVQPISWALDYTLHLYPLPHTIVLADRLIQSVFSYSGVACFSPGSFSHDGSFIVYRPGTKETEVSSI